MAILFTVWQRICVQDLRFYTLLIHKCSLKVHTCTSAQTVLLTKKEIPSVSYMYL